MCFGYQLDEKDNVVRRTLLERRKCEMCNLLWMKIIIYKGTYVKKALRHGHALFVVDLNHVDHESIFLETSMIHLGNFEIVPSH